MTTTTAPEQMRDTLAERLMQATRGMFDIFTTYLGDRLGLYRALAARGPSTSADLARYAGVDERYVREWLEQQTVTGTLFVDDAHSAPDDRRYCLPAGHADVLVEKDSLSYGAAGAADGGHSSAGADDPGRLPLGRGRAVRRVWRRHARGSGWAEPRHVSAGAQSAMAAGHPFSGISLLPIDNDFYAFYRLIS